MGAKDFVSLAFSILQIADLRPARCRTAIGRAYYGAFHVAIETLAVVHVQVYEGPQAHEHVVRLLHHGNDHELRFAANSLGNLRSWRNSADYRLSDSTAESETRTGLAIQAALSIISKFEQLRGDSSRCSEVGELIVAYAQKTKTGHII
jgi:hypothetical protein